MGWRTCTLNSRAYSINLNISVVCASNFYTRKIAVKSKRLLFPFFLLKIFVQIAVSLQIPETANTQSIINVLNFTDMETRQKESLSLSETQKRARFADISEDKCNQKYEDSDDVSTDSLELNQDFKTIFLDQKQQSPKLELRNVCRSSSVSPHSSSNGETSKKRNKKARLTASKSEITFKDLRKYARKSESFNQRQDTQLQFRSRRKGISIIPSSSKSQAQELREDANKKAMTQQREIVRDQMAVTVERSYQSELHNLIVDLSQDDGEKLLFTSVFFYLLACCVNKPTHQTCCLIEILHVFDIYLIKCLILLIKLKK